MGNSQANEEIKQKTGENFETEHAINSDRLKQLYYKTCSTYKQHWMNKESFQDQCLPNIPRLSSKIYDSMAKGNASDTKEGLSEADFIDKSLELLSVTSGSEQAKFYYDLFVKDAAELHTDGLLQLMESAYISAIYSCGMRDYARSDLADTIDTVYKSMFSLKEEVDFSTFSGWMTRNCNRLLPSLHQYISKCLLSQSTTYHVASYSETAAQKGDAEEQTSEDKYFRASPLHEGRTLLTLPKAWLLSCCLPVTYFDTASYVDQSGPASQLGCVGNGGWRLLYSSEEQGLSVNRFQHHVFSYDAPTVTLFSFEGHSYCVSCTQGWREGRAAWGGADCQLVQLHPVFKLLNSGADMLILNLKNRDLPRGLQIGADPKTRFLQIDEDFHKVKHYGVDFSLHRLEVWGCGGEEEHRKQQQQRDWEKRDAQKQRDRKLKLDDWEDSPDRQLLQMGGVTTSHAQR